MSLSFCLPVLALFICANLSIFVAIRGPKDNGDIFVISNEEQDDSMGSEISQEIEAAVNIDFDAITQMCNSSFRMPPSYITQFNTTARLPDEVDKTGMCYYRCYFEKSGLMDNWKMNTTLVRKYMWPATGASLEYCERQGKNETNECVRAYAIVKCITLRALTDARNKPMV